MEQNPVYFNTPGNVTLVSDNKYLYDFWVTREMRLWSEDRK
jgi:hypothetical protein